MLAIRGGPKVREKPWPPYPIIGEAERKAVGRVLDRGLLQGFRASWGSWFHGGPEVRAFEKQVAESLGVRYAISYSSATAALHGALFACDIREGDNVIVTPYSFNSSAVAPLYVNAVPVFADISPETFGLCPCSVELAISDKTRAIIAVDLFGIPAHMRKLREIARECNLWLIEDAAQAPLACLNGQPCGTFGDIGIFSFVGEKNASCGEGGMAVTDSPDLAHRLALLRNHGDALYEPMLGYNYRMTELQAAIGTEQWRSLPHTNLSRRMLVATLDNLLADISGLSIPVLPRGRQPAWYALPLLYDAEVTGVPRGLFVEAMCAEGIPVGGGYINPLYRIPLFQRRAHIAWRLYDGLVDYSPGLCPVCEEMWSRRLMITSVVRPPATESDMKDIATAARKVIEECQ